MGAMILPSRFNQQPQHSPQIDWTNPIAKGLDVAFVRLDMPGLVGPAKVAKIGNPTLTPAQYGMGHYFGGSAVDSFSSSGWPVLADGTEYTYLVVAQVNSTASQGHLINGDDGSFRAFQFRIDAGGALQMIAFNTAVGTGTASIGGVTTNRPHAFLARVTAANISLYQNGALVNSVAGPGGTLKGQSSTAIQIANRGSGTNLPGSIGLVVRWPRALSDAEARAVTASPWQLFAAPPLRLRAVASAGASNTPVNPGAGALTITSYAPSIAQTANQSLSPGAGGLAFTGYAPTIAQPHAVAPGAGSLVLTGYAPTITQAANVAIAPVAAALTITGFAPSVVRTAGASVLPGAGALALTGYPPAVVQTQNVALTPGAAPLAVTGYAPTVVQTAPVISFSVRFDRLPKSPIDVVHFSSP